MSARCRASIAEVAESVQDGTPPLTVLSRRATAICRTARSGALVESGRTSPGGPLPMSTRGGGPLHTRPGKIAIFPLIEATRQLRGDAAGTQRQVRGAELTLAHGAGGCCRPRPPSCWEGDGHGRDRGGC